ncbi:Fungal transcriptional regulatory protein, N-terminal [Penicillium camemberti]|uniref:Fungal transcriptional regulatory protein, N-terminal n=1 Tax=Penicillium camemberti (strain FM 013) TaxID=1429867 RepID=A0A0G4NVD8_PENC3|nr:Fungal transcriptional regulatory protein, N-terminal [Penicillium camemberti]
MPQEHIPVDPPIYGQTKGGLCGRISRWLWSGWRGTAFEDPPDLQKPYQLNPGDCKACREQRTACDHTRPQCSHCWSQQLLCFYVDPEQKKQKGHRKPTVREVETVSRLT